MAAARRANPVELTSALNRTEAHAFYRELGFEPSSLRFGKVLRKY
jgi:hypothetical protein